MARRIEQITRKRNKRREKQCILFNFEGNNKTEEIYFKNYQSREKPYYIKPINNHATDPLQMMEVLINYMQRKGIIISDNYKVYCVFDTDLNSDKQDRINQAIELGKKNGIEPIVSTPCFEIWYREHFKYTSRSYISNEALLDDLKKFIPDYEKNIDIYDCIKDKTKKAIENCKKLEKEQLKNGKILGNCNCNPYTSVYKVVEYLINYI